jgi:hypothetical protein
MLKDREELNVPRAARCYATALAHLHVMNQDAEERSNLRAELRLLEPKLKTASASSYAQLKGVYCRLLASDHEAESGTAALADLKEHKNEHACCLLHEVLESETPYEARLLVVQGGESKDRGWMKIAGLCSAPGSSKDTCRQAIQEHLGDNSCVQSTVLDPWPEEQ